METRLLLNNLPGLAYRCAAAPPWPMDYVSPGVQPLCGYAPEDLLSGRVTWGSIVHPEDLASLERGLACAVAEGRAFELIYRIVTADGTVRWVHEKGAPVPAPPGESPALIGFIMNITVDDLVGRTPAGAQVLNEGALARTLDAELLYLSHQGAMGTMAATLAHELNQPLSAITFLAAAARRGADSNGAADPAVVEALVSLEANAFRAAEIIRRLRDAVRAGTPRRERFPCKPLIEEAIAFSSIGCEGVSFELDLTGEVVEADRVQIQQVLVNLIRNACEAVRDRSDATVRITTTAQPGAPMMLRVSVADNGPGISDELLPRLFDTRLSTKPTGMGLGLSISRTIVEAHGGRIWAENRDGACFHFEVPLARDSR